MMFQILDGRWFWGGTESELVPKDICTSPAPINDTWLEFELADGLPNSQSDLLQD